MIKAITHRAYLLSTRDIKELIYLLQTCNPKNCGDAAHKMQLLMDNEVTEIDFRSKGGN